MRAPKHDEETEAELNDSPVSSNCWPALCWAVLRVISPNSQQLYKILSTGLAVDAAIAGLHADAKPCVWTPPVPPPSHPSLLTASSSSPLPGECTPWAEGTADRPAHPAGLGETPWHKKGLVLGNRGAATKRPSQLTWALVLEMLPTSWVLLHKAQKASPRCWETGVLRRKWKWVLLHKAQKASPGCWEQAFWGWSVSGYHLGGETV